MKPEDADAGQAFCAGKVIRRIELPTADTLRLIFTNDTGVEIREPRAGAKGRVVRLIRPTTAINTVNWRRRATICRRRGRTSPSRAPLERTSGRMPTTT